MLKWFGKTAARKAMGQGLYTVLVARARDPVFFREFEVPDTVDGRFDLVALHGWLVLERLKIAGMNDEAQALMDGLFISFDEALREQGTGDMGMGRRMKAIANAFFGRLAAYSAAKDEAALAEALAKNVWRGGPVNARTLVLAIYVAGARAALEQSALANGHLDFGPLPDMKDEQ